MDKYRRVEKAKVQDALPVEANEIRITHQGAVRSYISYANGLFTDKNERVVVLKAMGNAISKAVTITEILKHRIAGLHQITKISSIETMDVYEPLEEGLDRIETKRHIPSIAIQLSLDALSKDDPGYQSPIPSELLSTAFGDREPHKAVRRSERKKKKNRAATGTADAAAAVADDDTADQENTPRHANAVDAGPPTSPLMPHDGDSESLGDESKPAAGKVTKPSRRKNRRGGAKRKPRDSSRVVTDARNSDGDDGAAAAKNDELKPAARGGDAGDSSASTTAAASKRSSRPRKPRPYRDASAIANGDDATEQQRHAASGDDGDDSTRASRGRGCGRGGRSRGRGRGDHSAGVGATNSSAAAHFENAAVTGAAE